MDKHPDLRRCTIHLLRSLCGSWGVLPASYTLHEEVIIPETQPRTAGGFSAVWYGTMGSEKVAVKVITLKSCDNDNPKKLKKVCTRPTHATDVGLTSTQQLAKEVIIWKHLKHRNILPFYGVSTSIKFCGVKTVNPCLVSPWMVNGNIRVFGQNNPTFNRFKLVGGFPFAMKQHANSL